MSRKKVKNYAKENEEALARCEDMLEEAKTVAIETSENIDEQTRQLKEITHGMNKRLSNLSVAVSQFETCGKRRKWYHFGIKTNSRRKSKPLKPSTIASTSRKSFIKEIRTKILPRTSRAGLQMEDEPDLTLDRINSLVRTLNGLATNISMKLTFQDELLDEISSESEKVDRKIKKKAKRSSSKIKHPFIEIHINK